MDAVNISSKDWVALILATLLTIGISYMVGRMFTFESFAFAWSLNFILMIWYTYLSSKKVFTLESSYFNAKPFEKKGKIYTYFGVNIYRKLLVWSGWEKINRKNNHIKNDLTSLKTCEYNTRASEHGHTIIAFIVFGVAIGTSSTWNEAKWLISTNVFLNIYPTMVQRFNRPRYNKIIGSKMEKDILLFS